MLCTSSTSPSLCPEPSIVTLRFNAHTISVVLRHAESKLVFVDYQSESVVLEAIDLFSSGSPHPRLVIIAEGSESRVLKSRFVLDYDTVLLNDDPNFDWVRPESEFDPLTLNYTSGTTSSPNMLTNILNRKPLENPMEILTPKRASRGGAVPDRITLLCCEPRVRSRPKGL